MTKCRFWENRYLPIEYSLENMQSTEGYFSLCLIKRGNAVVSVDGIKCYLSAPALLCLNPDRKAEIIRSAKLQMKTIFFAPEFINRNLSVERITADDYELNCRLFDFPIQISPCTSSVKLFNGDMKHVPTISPLRLHQLRSKPAPTAFPLNVSTG